VTTQDGWRVGRLARDTGISVRTLHHYDDIGLLKPSRRTASGHRLYTAADVERLQKIVCLRDLGLSLLDIGVCLDRDHATLQVVLEAHEAALGKRVEAARRLHRRLQDLIAALRRGDQIPVEHIIQNIEEMTTMFHKYYTPEQMEDFRKSAEALGDSGMRKAQDDWQELMAAVRAEMDRGTDPQSPTVQALAKRWGDLVKAFTQGNPQVEQALKTMHREERATGDPQWFPDPAMLDYIKRASSSGSV